MKTLHYVLLLSAALLYNKAMSNPVKAEDWSSIQAARQQQLAHYLNDNQVAYNWFADFSLGINDGVPFIIL